MKGYDTMLWLAGKVFLDRDFVRKLDEEGLDKILLDCPYDDLSDDQRQTFLDTFNNQVMRALVALWWASYDELREMGVIAGTNSPWIP